MENNENKLNKNSSSKSQNNTVNTTNDNNEKERIKKIQNEVHISREIFGASGSEDINKNLGVFTTKEPSNVPISTPNTDVDKKDKINFQKFENTSRYKAKKSYSKNKFLEWFAVLLRSKKGFWTILSLEVFFILAIVAVSIVLIVVTKSVIFGFSGDGPLNNAALIKLGHIGYIFSIIALCPLAIPIIYLVTAWFIGINQVMSSRNFHLVTIIIILVCFLCLIVSVVCCGIPLVDNANFIH